MTTDTKNDAGSAPLEREVGRVEPEHYFDDSDECFEEPCSYCRGDGRDPYTDYLMACPYCDGSW